MEALTGFTEVTTSGQESSITSLCADLNAATFGGRTITRMQIQKTNQFTEHTFLTSSAPD